MGNKKPPLPGLLEALGDDQEYEDIALNSARILEIIRSKEFWVIRTHAAEWQYTLNEIAREFLPKPAPAGSFFMGHIGEEIVYFFGRRFIPVEVLAIRLGLDIEGLKKAHEVNMRPAAPEPKAPTVNYWGTA